MAWMWGLRPVCGSHRVWRGVCDCVCACVRVCVEVGGRMVRMSGWVGGLARARWAVVCRGRVTSAVCVGVGVGRVGVVCVCSGVVWAHVRWGWGRGGGDGAGEGGWE